MNGKYLFGLIGAMCKLQGRNESEVYKLFGWSRSGYFYKKSKPESVTVADLVAVADALKLTDEEVLKVLGRR